MTELDLGVTTVVAPTTQTQTKAPAAKDDYSFLDDSGAFVEDENGASSTPAVDNSQKSTTTSEPIVAPAEKLATIDLSKYSEEQLEALTEQFSPRFKKRIDKITEASKLQMLAKDREVAQLKAQLDMVNRQFENKASRLAQFEPSDPIAAELEQLKSEREISQLHQRMNEEFRQKLAAEQKQERVSTMAESFSQQMVDSIAKYDLVSKEELAIAVRGNFRLPKDQRKPIDALASQIQANREQIAEQRTLAKYKDRLNPPRPIGAANNNFSAPKIQTTDDLIASLDADLGPDWAR